VIVFAAITLAVVAQVKPVQVEPRERRTVINLDEDIIEASPLGPKDVVVHAPPKSKFRSLIKVRSSFEQELLASVGSLRNSLRN
jgi:hypothetical protein